MKITDKLLRDAARNFVWMLEREGVSDFDSLNRRGNERFKVRNKPTNFVDVKRRVSPFGIPHCSITYSIKNIGTIISVYPLSKSILALEINSGREIDGYRELERDAYGNILQMRGATGFSRLREELEKLGGLISENQDVNHRR